MVGVFHWNSPTFKVSERFKSKLYERYLKFMRIKQALLAIEFQHLFMILLYYA